MTKGLQQLKSVRLSISGDTVTTKDRATDRVATIGIVQNFAKVLCQPQLEEFTVSYDMSRTSGMIHVALTKNLNLENIKKLAVDGVYISASALVKITDRRTYGCNPRAGEARFSGTLRKWCAAMSSIMDVIVYH